MVDVVYIGDWKPYEAELHEVFGYKRPPDPDPSEWFPTKDFYGFRPYLDALKAVTKAKQELEEPHARFVARGRDRNDESIEAAYRQADAAVKAAEKELERLESDTIGEIRVRAENKLNELRRHSGHPAR